MLLPDMEPAVARTAAAVRAGERIAAHGDYDADGIT
jgi:single-stranded DNA-specific DHH superfamily exonuclease